MASILSTFIKIATKPTLSDLWSYEQRTGKRLLRRVLRLADRISKSERVCKDATTLEVWIACVVPVMQGYWRSGVEEEKKKRALDNFYHVIFDIIFNDLALPSKEFGQLKNGGQDEFYDNFISNLDKQVRERTEEYIPAIFAFLNRPRETNNMPKELMEALIYNLFDTLGSPGKDLRKLDSSLFMEIMLEVALPMITAFGENLKG